MNQHKKQIRLNQKGASAIMFALFFIMVISLISLGFATLSRRDQRSTLDKTLSAQAQLAAESGINAVKQYFDATPTVLEKTDCADESTVSYPKFSNGTSITCLTWDATPTEAVKVLEPYKGWSFTNSTPSAFDRISWETQESVGLYGGIAGRRASLPQLNTANASILKLVSVPLNDITNTVSPKVEVIYLVPGNNGVIPSAVTLGDGANNTNGNGSVFNVNCSSNKCSANISGYASPSSGTQRMYYIQLIGSKTATITYSSPDGAGNLQQLTGLQAKVDVNVLSQDQSKRLVSYIPIASTSTNWQPFFSALADSLCKDIKIDGGNANPVSGTAVCPAP
jgi:Tfp pilus assembly protein PilX